MIAYTGRPAVHSSPVQTGSMRSVARSCGVASASSLCEPTHRLDDHRTIAVRQRPVVGDLAQDRNALSSVWQWDLQRPPEGFERRTVGDERATAAEDRWSAQRLFRRIPASLDQQKPADASLAAGAASEMRSKLGDGHIVDRSLATAVGRAGEREDPVRGTCLFFDCGLRSCRRRAALRAWRRCWTRTGRV